MVEKGGGSDFKKLKCSISSLTGATGSYESEGLPGDRRCAGVVDELGSDASIYQTQKIVREREIEVKGVKVKKRKNSIIECELRKNS